MEENVKDEINFLAWNRRLDKTGFRINPLEEFRWYSNGLQNNKNR